MKLCKISPKRLHLLMKPTKPWNPEDPQPLHHKDPRCMWPSSGNRLGRLRPVPTCPAGFTVAVSPRGRWGASETWFYSAGSDGGGERVRDRNMWREHGTWGKCSIQIKIYIHEYEFYCFGPEFWSAPLRPGSGWAGKRIFVGRTEASRSSTSWSCSSASNCLQEQTKLHVKEKRSTLSPAPPRVSHLLFLTSSCTTCSFRRAVSWARALTRGWSPALFLQEPDSV